MTSSLDHKQSINLIRLINRIESHSQRLAMPTFHEHNRSEVDPEQWYWELKSLETTVRHAKTILDTLDSNPITAQTISQIIAQDPSTLKHRLKVVQARIQAALQACPPPTPPASPPLRLTTKPPQPPALPTYLPAKNKSTDCEKDHYEPQSTPPSDRIKTHQIPNPVPKIDSKPIDHHMLNNQNLTTEESLTKELSEMASQLKLNAQHFGALLSKDKEIIEKNVTTLELNEKRMKSEGNRLGQVSIKGRQMTWFTIFSVIGVVVAWFLMFIIIRFS
ncbi:hypothetical protein CROQUDRAFT_87088 [Cronartium quercuum f. sp. fusiforme G11]|uniref:Uncharacterized protein n=1 Tax=Cronartium quercuum f. sp. fusiforme G11 TaxID=708437 RepID=A0A9P6NQ37_9BASI|nr:hypothetical protein CROQUDRAFT_87088 [Cronartium quercuum f. sp. fusiforme G11]